MDPTSPYQKCGQVRLNKLVLNLVAVPICLLVLIVFVCVAFVLRDRGSPFESRLWLFLVFVMPFAVLHELLHGWAAVLWGGLRMKHIRFGIHWKALIPYCHYTLPLSIKGYRRVTLFPLYVTGAISVALMLVAPKLWSAMLAATAVSTCIGDIWIFLKLRRFDEASMVNDHPSEIGCDIFRNDDTSSAAVRSASAA